MRGLKLQNIVLTFTLAALFISCKTIGGRAETGKDAAEYREIENELQKRQTALAVTGERIESESNKIVEDISWLEKSLSAILPADSGLVEQTRILKARAEKLQTEAENLNRQLAAERETNSALAAKFNDYEADQNKALAELAVVKADNKKLEGQRNTLLAIIITAILAIIIFIAIKVLRAFKVLPF